MIPTNEGGRAAVARPSLTFTDGAPARALPVTMLSAHTPAGDAPLVARDRGLVQAGVADSTGNHDADDSLTQQHH